MTREQAKEEIAKAITGDIEIQVIDKIFDIHEAQMKTKDGKMSLLTLALEAVENHILNLQKDLNNAEKELAKLDDIIVCGTFQNFTSDEILQRVKNVLKARGYAINNDVALVKLREIVIESKKDKS